MRRECVNANMKSDVYLKQFENLVKFKKTFDAKFNDRLAVNTESLQEIENKERDKEINLPQLRLVDVDTVLDKWTDETFKQM